MAKRSSPPPSEAGLRSRAEAWILEDMTRRHQVEAFLRKYSRVIEQTASTVLITSTVCTASDRAMAHVTVRDRGSGLDKQTLQRIFDPFFSTEASGIAMGLPISRAIIEVHGGRLWVEPVEGGRAGFHFTLPFRP